jgi:DNA-binding NarL/FixJ family response regulator
VYQEDDTPAWLSRYNPNQNSFVHLSPPGYGTLPESKIHFSPGGSSPVSPEKANILKQIADGHNYRTIAKNVGTTEQVIKNIVQKLCRANAAPNRVALVARALRKGTIS